jgi:serine/threonine protein kinase, bacterial
MRSEPIAKLGTDSLVGAYRIVKEIGRGGMATVYEATHTVLPRRAAVKVMHPALLGQPGMATRLVQEAAILEGVRHPGVVRVYDCGLLPDHRPWLAMELVIGETLASWLQRRLTLPAADVAALIGDVADVLAAVHDIGVVHRDLKPDNLLCTPGDRDYPLRVLDWGVARLGVSGRLTLDGLTPGTPIYMSPEQATGRNIASPSDIYSLGVIAYEALTGSPPFDGRTVSEVVCMHLSRKPAPLRARCNAPDELCELVESMLQKDPALRPCPVEVRQVGWAIAQALSPAHEKLAQSRNERSRSEECRSESRSESDGALGAASGESLYPTPASHLGETPPVDADALEYGVTEMLPVVPRPRWTPEIGHVSSALAADQGHLAAAPRTPRDRGTGEIVLLEKPH